MMLCLPGWIRITFVRRQTLLHHISIYLESRSITLTSYLILFGGWILLMEFTHQPSFFIRQRPAWRGPRPGRRRRYRCHKRCGWHSTQLCLRDNGWIIIRSILRWLAV